MSRLWKKLKTILPGRAAQARIIGYYNGSCPLCDVHIGTDVTTDILGRRSARCGACGREIYRLLIKREIRWLEAG